MICVVVVSLSLLGASCLQSFHISIVFFRDSLELRRNILPSSLYSMFTPMNYSSLFPLNPFQWFSCSLSSPLSSSPLSRLQQSLSLFSFSVMSAVFFVLLFRRRRTTQFQSDPASASLSPLSSLLSLAPSSSPLLSSLSTCILSLSPDSGDEFRPGATKNTLNNSSGCGEEDDDGGVVRNNKGRMHVAVVVVGGDLKGDAGGVEQRVWLLRRQEGLHLHAYTHTVTRRCVYVLLAAAAATKHRSDDGDESA